MTGFEALFSFYGLLLGLAVASVTSGLGDMWRRRRRRPIGALIPLLGLYILLAAAQQWKSFYAAGVSLDMTAVNLLTSLGMALPYVFAAQILFPEADEAAPDGDTHFRAQRRVLAFVLMLPLGLSLAYNWISEGITAADLPTAISSHILPLLVLGGVLFTRARRWLLAALLLLVADRLLVIFT